MHSSFDHGLRDLSRLHRLGFVYRGARCYRLNRRVGRTRIDHLRHDLATAFVTAFAALAVTPAATAAAFTGFASVGAILTRCSVGGRLGVAAGLRCVAHGAIRGLAHRRSRLRSLGTADRGFIAITTATATTAVAAASTLTFTLCVTTFGRIAAGRLGIDERLRRHGLFASTFGAWRSGARLAFGARATTALATRLTATFAAVVIARARCARFAAIRVQGLAAHGLVAHWAIVALGATAATFATVATLGATTFAAFGTTLTTAAFATFAATAFTALAVTTIAATTTTAATALATTLTAFAGLRCCDGRLR